MIHLPSVGLPLVTFLALRGLLILLLGIVISIMSSLSTVVTQIGATRCIGLHWGSVGITLA
jgi:hypothetical protein